MLCRLIVRRQLRAPRSDGPIHGSEGRFLLEKTPIINRPSAQRNFRAGGSDHEKHNPPFVQREWGAYCSFVVKVTGVTSAFWILGILIVCVC